MNTKHLFVSIGALAIAAASNAVVAVNRQPIPGSTFSDSSLGQFVANSFIVPGAGGKLRLRRLTLWAEFVSVPSAFSNQFFSIGLFADNAGLPGTKITGPGFSQNGMVLTDRMRKYVLNINTVTVDFDLGSRYWLNFTGSGGFNFGNQMKWVYGEAPGGIGVTSTSQFSGYSAQAPNNSYAFVLEGDVTLTGPATISGRLDLQGWTGESATTADIEVYQDGSLARTINDVQVAPNGNFSTTLSMSGDVQLRFVVPHFLARRTTDLTLGFTTVNVNPTLINGDIDGDNEITLVDNGMLAANFGFEGQVGDLDGDGEVNIVDAGIVSANFGLLGDE